MRKLAAVFLLAVLPAAVPVRAEGGDDPFARYLFPPDRIMSHSLEIGLEDSQKTVIKNEVRKAQPKFTDAQFELQAEAEKMIHLLQERPVDESKVLAEVDRILVVEKEIKRAQITLLVRIKNVLTPAQQTKLAELQKLQAEHDSHKAGGE